MRNIYILFILIGMSCSDEPTTEQKDQKTNASKSEVTTKSLVDNIDAPRIYCNIDGQQWQGGAVSGNLINENELDLAIVDITGVAPIKNNVDYTTMINLHIRKFTGVGTYDKNIGFSIKKLFRNQPDMMEDQTEFGTLKVTKWDDETKTISGEFTTAIHTNTKRKHDITEGHFSNVILKEVNIH